jgi:hypothetical protein
MALDLLRLISSAKSFGNAYSLHPKEQKKLLILQCI